MLILWGAPLFPDYIPAILAITIPSVLAIRDIRKGK